MKAIGMDYEDVDASPNVHIYIMDIMHQKTNAHNVKLVDIELIN